MMGRRGKSNLSVGSSPIWSQYPGAGLEQSQEPRILSGSPMGGRGSNVWVVCCFFPDPSAGNCIGSRTACTEIGTPAWIAMAV